MQWSRSVCARAFQFWHWCTLMYIIYWNSHFNLLRHHVNQRLYMVSPCLQNRLVCFLAHKILDVHQCQNWRTLVCAGRLSLGPAPAQYSYYQFCSDLITTQAHKSSSIWNRGNLSKMPLFQLEKYFITMLKLLLLCFDAVISVVAWGCLF